MGLALAKSRKTGVPTGTVLYPPNWWVRRQVKRTRRNIQRQQENQANARARFESEMNRYRGSSQDLRKKPPTTEQQ
jgi:hypothetical protein